jgi:hypothetical protein
MKRALVGMLVLLAGAACADKTLTGPALLNLTRLSFRVSTTAIAPQGGTPSGGPFLVVASGYIDGANGLQLLGYSVRPAAPAEYAIDLDVDLTPCIEASARIGRGGCALLLGAAILRDTLVLASRSGDPLAGAIDKQFPLGPFLVVPGRPVVIAPITLSLRGSADARPASIVPRHDGGEP